jgi:hypothetical protein
MKIFSFMAVLSLFPITGSGQNLVGCKAEHIRHYMNENRNEMNPEKVINKSFRYLKYSDKNDTQTMLFFLNPDSVCQNIRIVCNNSIRDSKIKELDSSFSKRGNNFWIDMKSGKKYFVRLEDEEWSFSVTIEPEK